MSFELTWTDSFHTYVKLVSLLLVLFLVAEAAAVEGVVQVRRHLLALEEAVDDVTATPP